MRSARRRSTVARACATCAGVASRISRAITWSRVTTPRSYSRWRISTFRCACTSCQYARSVSVMFWIRFCLSLATASRSALRLIRTCASDTSLPNPCRSGCSNRSVHATSSAGLGTLLTPGVSTSALERSCWKVNCPPEISGRRSAVLFEIVCRWSLVFPVVESPCRDCARGWSILLYSVLLLKTQSNAASAATTCASAIAGCSRAN